MIAQQATMPPDVVIENLMQDAFPAARRIKSGYYREGARSVLAERLPGASPVPGPGVAPGSTAYDAWMAGRQEGKEIARRAGLKKASAFAVLPDRASLRLEEVSRWRLPLPFDTAEADQ